MLVFKMGMMPMIFLWIDPNMISQINNKNIKISRFGMITKETNFFQCSNEINVSNQTNRTTFNNEKTHNVWSVIEGADMKNRKQCKQ